MKIHIHTLGCKVNQYETQAMETILTQHGHIISLEDCNCDAVIINTCAVTAESGRKSRQAIRRLKSLNPDAIIGVCGCFSQVEPKDIVALGADVVFGSAQRTEFIEALEAEFESRSTVINIDEPLKRRIFEELPSGNLQGRTRAMLKIQDGCSNFCTYCIIPYARGPVRSMPIDAVKSSATELAKRGYREIVITGIEIASYGKDLKDGSNLASAVKAIAEAAPNVRLRLGSLEPRVITEEFCSLLSSLDNLCPHFHLSLQSGCDNTLKGMKRKYTSERFYESVSFLRKYFPNCGLTADLIVGFPNETEEDFDETLTFIKKCGFSSMHIFPYSPRPGTPAAAMDGQLTRNEKKSRADRASKVANAMQIAFLNSCIGTTQQVLFEQETNGVSTGHAENYCEVTVIAENLHNKIMPVIITGISGNSLIGNIVNTPNSYGGI